MKILTAILTCSGTQKRADACIDTWIKDIKSPHEYYFYGSKTQSKKMNRTWNCESDEGEARDRLPEKTYRMLVESLNHDWDFLFKCDDDTFVVFDGLIDLLKKYHPDDDLYIGMGIVNPFAYAQGGAGYALTRGAVKKCIKSLKHLCNDESKNKYAEDYSVGLALKEQGINLTNTSLLTTPNKPKAKKDQRICVNAIVNYGKITTHYVKPNTMKNIYDIFKK